MSRILTPAEEAYCGKHAAAQERIAGRFAAKEAILKALGTGLGGGVTWRQIEILPDEKGAPHAKFSGALARKMKAVSAPQGTTHCHLSISHQGDYAVAFAVLEALP